MDRFYHNSFELTYRNPFGAVTCGTTIRLTADTEGVYSTCHIMVRTWSESTGEYVYHMETHEDRSFVDIPIPNEPGLFWYYFIIQYPDGNQTFYCGSHGEGHLCPTPEDNFCITVYLNSYTTPKWFCEGVCYQIFPDRFFKSNDKEFKKRIASHTKLGEKPRIHKNWDEQPLTTPPDGEEDYVPNDFFGGDLNGITNKLDYLASFGVTCIYLNPIFCSDTNHRYNTADYMHVDPILGTENDLKKLVKEAKKRGIQIMLDGVFSHTGSDSIYFNKNGIYGKTGAYQDPDSEYRDWYTFHEDGTYDCWWGFQTLPNVNELNPSYLNYITGPEGVLKHWADFGIYNWRLDVADELPDDFIRALRTKLKELNPDGVLLGEVWDEPTTKIGSEGRRGYVNGDELDSVMNYTYTDSVLDLLNEKINAVAFADSMMVMQERYPEPFYKACLNLMSSHDVPRELTALANAPSKYDLTREEQAVYTSSEEDLIKAKKRILLSAVLRVFLPGVPCLYYGDEAGMLGMGDPMNRCTYPWGKEDLSIMMPMQSIFSLRKKHKALRNGKVRFGAYNDVFTIVRYTDKECAIAFINTRAQDESVLLTSDSLPEGPYGKEAIPLMGNYIDQNRNKYSFDNDIELTLPGYSYLTLFKTTLH